MDVVFDGIVDYAGLFPPASLDLASAVRAFDGYRRSPARAMLARFVIAATRLPDLSQSLTQLAIALDPTDPWRLSVVTSGALNVDLGLIGRFATAWSARGVIIDAIERRVETAAEVHLTADAVPAGIACFLEVPPNGPYQELVAAIGRSGARGKVRTGGVAPELFPSSSDLVEFLAAVTSLHVPFKATAGLHHPLRGSYPLTYAEDASHHTMFGFVNVLLATTELFLGGTTARAIAILDEQDPGSIASVAEGIEWHGHTYTVTDLVTVREQLFLGFGSCSFQEPVDGIRELAVA